MKKMVLSFTALSVLAFAVLISVPSAQACDAYTGVVKYDCIRNALQAIDSDTMFQLSNEEIDTLLTSCAYGQHEVAVTTAERCAAQQ